VNAHHVGGHRIQHFIAEHDAGKNGGQAIEPGHALEQVRYSRRERVPASLAKIGRELEDKIVARHSPEALQLLEQRRGERAAPAPTSSTSSNPASSTCFTAARERLP